ncbi:MAG: hypothetical protein ACI3ZC_05590 [Candidatus Cryptobacteroides sp.]
MKYRALISLAAAISLSACEEKVTSPQDISVPEFIDIQYDFGTFLSNRYVVLSATLNTDAGIKDAGFMVGFNETALSYQTVAVKDLKITTVINFIDFDTEYCFYAKASNGMNEIRTRLVRFRTPAKEDGFKPGSGEGDSGGDNPGGSGEGGEDSGENNPPLPPDGVGITVSDNNFLNYLLGICDEDKDGVILSGEAACVEEIEVCTDEIHTLDGVQYFSSLHSLTADGSVWKGQLTSIALNFNGRLEKLSCRYNHISSFLLPSSLLELDLRFNDMVKPDFRDVPHLRKLDCFGNNITELDLSPLTELEELVCGMNSFSTLDVSVCPFLSYLDVGDSPYLKTVYVAKGQKIRTIIAENSVEFKYKE